MFWKVDNAFYPKVSLMTYKMSARVIEKKGRGQMAEKCSPNLAFSITENPQNW